MKMVTKRGVFCELELLWVGDGCCLDCGINWHMWHMITPQSLVYFNELFLDFCKRDHHVFRVGGNMDGLLIQRSGL
jgi:hypothetical protein